MPRCVILHLAQILHSVGFSCIIICVRQRARFGWYDTWNSGLIYGEWRTYALSYSTPRINFGLCSEDRIALTMSVCGPLGLLLPAMITPLNRQRTRSAEATVQELAHVKWLPVCPISAVSSTTRCGTLSARVNIMICLFHVALHVR